MSFTINPQLVRGSAVDKVYLQYLRGFVMARTGCIPAPELLSTSPEELAGFALGVSHGSSDGVPVHGARTVAETLLAMLTDPRVDPADAERHEEAEQVEAEEQRAAVLVALRKRGGLFGTPNVYEA